MNTTSRFLRTKYHDIIRMLIERERHLTCGPDSRVGYGKFHNFRFQRLLEVCRHYVPSQAARVLDVGRSDLTTALASYYRSVTTIGFELGEDDGGHRETEPLNDVPHLVFDLNRSADVEAWPEMPQAFDLIVYSEAIEHIHTAPELSLLMLSWLLKDGGKIIVSTPNAAAIQNRRRLLRGVNPFERIRYYDKNPGHFREYTADELRDMAEATELHCLQVERINFYRRGGRQRLFASWRDSLIAIYEKRPQ
jgi:2-polyprenyl-3-methyl-5-hydroxy-6-metoxy-1,4-benzoquinol methylase